VLYSTGDVDFTIVRWCMASWKCINIHEDWRAYVRQSQYTSSRALGSSSKAAALQLGYFSRWCAPRFSEVGHRCHRDTMPHCGIQYTWMPARPHDQRPEALRGAQLDLRDPRGQYSDAVDILIISAACTAAHKSSCRTWSSCPPSDPVLHPSRQREI